MQLSCKITSKLVLLLRTNKKNCGHCIICSVIGNDSQITRERDENASGIKMYFTQFQAQTIRTGHYTVERSCISLFLFFTIKISAMCVSAKKLKIGVLRLEIIIFHNFTCWSDDETVLIYSKTIIDYTYL